jgi:hypothetical protein
MNDKQQPQLYPCNVVVMSIDPENNDLMGIELRTPSGATHLVFVHKDTVKYIDISPSGELIIRVEV